MAARVTIVDAGVGNLTSLCNAFRFIGVESEITADPLVVVRAGRLVLPGVGAFGYAMRRLRETGLDTAICEAAQHATPILGICLGMQLLFETSEEAPGESGLGLLAGGVKRITAARKVPHTGWNQVALTRAAGLFRGLPTAGHAYFVHGYVCVPAYTADICAVTDYGRPFASAVERGLLFGVQFHPEKSQEFGLQILENFAEL